MSKDIRLWKVDEGEVEEILVDYGDKEEIIKIQELDATFENIRLLLDQSPSLFDALPLNSSEITYDDAQSDTSETTTETSKENEYEAWISGSQRWQPSDSDDVVQNQSRPSESSVFQTNLKDEPEIVGWEKMTTIEDNICPACDKELKNRHGVISHLSSGTCPADDSTIRQHQILNIRKQKLLIYVASMTEPVGDASSVTLKNIVQITGQENVKSPLDKLAEEEKLDKYSSDSNNPEYSITNTGLMEIERTFESNPNLLEEIAPTLSEWIFDKESEMNSKKDTSEGNVGKSDIDEIDWMNKSSKEIPCIPEWDEHFDEATSLKLIEPTHRETLPNPDIDENGTTLWSGKTLFSYLIPNDIEIAYNGSVGETIHIEKGEILAGAINAETEKSFISYLSDKIAQQSGEARLIQFVRDISGFVQCSLQVLQFPNSHDLIDRDLYNELRDLFLETREKNWELIESYRYNESTISNQSTSPEELGTSVMEAWKETQRTGMDMIKYYHSSDDV